MPQNVLSDINIPGNYIFPDNIGPDRTIDYEYGGIALNDPSKGLMYQVWTAKLYIDQFTFVGTVTVQAPTVPETVLFILPNVTEISLTFDSNMKPFIAFVQGGQARFWWFDTLINTQIFTDLPIGTGSPKASLDDKRKAQSQIADIILGYTRAGNLYFRMQRDRYLIEYLLKMGVVGQVLQIGMTDKIRLQFLIGDFG